MDHNFVGNFQVRHGRLRQPTKNSSRQLLFEVVHDFEGQCGFDCNETAPSTSWFVQARISDWTSGPVCVVLSMSKGVRVLRVHSRSETSGLMPKDDFDFVWFIMRKEACEIAHIPHQVLLRVLWCSQ